MGTERSDKMNAIEFFGREVQKLLEETNKKEKSLPCRCSECLRKLKEKEKKDE